jgi:putative proteasome-type protease
MTYCLGMLLEHGLIMMADTRTNAGVDNFSSFKKLHLLEDAPDRRIFACTAGSLSMSQTVISLIQEGLPAADGSEMSRSLREAQTMFRATQLVGEAVRSVRAGDAVMITPCLSCGRCPACPSPRRSPSECPARP